MGQRVDPELGVVGLAPPGVLVLGPVVDEEEDAGGRQALHEAVEKRLGLGIDPVEVFEDQQQRLDLTLAQQQALECVQGPLPALERVEGLPLGVFDWYVQERDRAGRVGIRASSSVRACAELRGLAPHRPDLGGGK